MALVVFLHPYARGYKFGWFFIMKWYDCYSRYIFLNNEQPVNLL